MRIEWSPSAVSDLKSIVEYIEQDRGLETANRVGRLIYNAVRGLRTMPYRGRQGRVENTRELLISSLPYLVVYRMFDEHVLILNIVHGAQKWP